MPTTALLKLDPRYSMAFRGFDRRGAGAAFTQATATGFKVSGNWADQVDFAVLVLHDADDVFGHLYTTKYLPDFDLTGIVLDADVALVNAYSAVSTKYDSLAAARLSYVKEDGTLGSVPLAPMVTSVSGGAFALCQVTIGSDPVVTDTFLIGFNGNFAVSFTGKTLAKDVAAAYEYQVNNAAYAFWGSSIVPYIIAEIVGGDFTNKFDVYAGRSAFKNTLGSGQPPDQFSFSGATMTIEQANLVGTDYDYRQLVGFWGVQVGDPVLVLKTASPGYERHTVASVTSPWVMELDSAPDASATMVCWPMYGQDGNTIQFWLHTDGSVAMTAGSATGTELFPKLSGGSELTSFHLMIDFSSLSLASLRQAWLTFGPNLDIDNSGDQTIKAFGAVDWGATFTNWAVTDPNSKRGLKVAGPGSVLVGVFDSNVKLSGLNGVLTSGWTKVAGFYVEGFASLSATANDQAFVAYNCQYAHDLYVGASLFTDRGIFSVELDGTMLSDLDTYLNVGSALQTRRKISSGVAAGRHVVVLKVKSTKNASSTGYNCILDYLHAVVASDVQDPTTTYPNVGMSFDYDTDQTYKLSPQRSLFIAKKAGFTGDIDFYGGVFFALKRVRYGGNFRQAAVTLSGSIVNGDAFFVTIGTTMLGVCVITGDTFKSLAQRMVNAINVTFVGVFATRLGTSGAFTITVLSPINGFSLSKTDGATLTVAISGDVGIQVAGGSYAGGQEGVWDVDPIQVSPLNRAFQDFFANFCAELVVQGMTCTAAWSQELLSPPDMHTSIATWSETRPVGNVDKAWCAVASDSDGSNLMAGVFGGRLYTSVDGGINWIERQPAGNFNKNWKAVASDSDGSHLVAGDSNGRLYTSADGGINWTERQPAGDFDRYWASVASSSDGSHLFVANSGGRLYVSTDGGTNWTETRPAGDVDKAWQTIAMDSDGSFLIAGVGGGPLTLGRLYTSADGGASWTERRPAGDVDKAWQAAASSSDGSHLIVGALYRLYLSTDSGANWAEIRPAGDVNLSWNVAASDSDGSNLIAGVFGGRLYVSTDNGTNWAETRPIGDIDGDWEDVASDSNGSHLIVGNLYYRLYLFGGGGISSGTWSQRYANDATVLTATGFGSWGAGFIEALSGITVTQTAHGYITGNITHVASATGSGSWRVVVADVNTYDLTTLIVKSSGYSPAVGDATLIELQTSQCAFNPGTVTDYLKKVYEQTASIMDTAGLTPWLQFGEVGHWFFSEVMSRIIVGFSNSSGLIKVETTSAHGFSTGQTVILAGTAITDGTKIVTVIDSTHFTVDGSTWPGGSPAARGTTTGGGMAYYDANQVAAALAYLGRALASFYTQDDDPTINSSADANFLASRVKDHTDAIVAYVLTSYAGAKFEVLWAGDVNFVPCYYTDVLPYPQGGKLNLAVNLPTAWKVKSGSNFDRFKMEALSWGATYRNIDNARAAIAYAYGVLSWGKSDTRYLIPWFNGGCPWPREYIFVNRESVPFVNFWAGDHFILLSWPLPLPIEVGTSNIT